MHSQTVHLTISRWYEAIKCLRWFSSFLLPFLCFADKRFWRWIIPCKNIRQTRNENQPFSENKKNWNYVANFYAWWYSTLYLLDMCVPFRWFRYNFSENSSNQKKRQINSGNMKRHRCRTTMNICIVNFVYIPPSSCYRFLFAHF